MPEHNVLAAGNDWGGRGNNELQRHLFAVVRGLDGQQHWVNGTGAYPPRASTVFSVFSLLDNINMGVGAMPYEPYVRDGKTRCLFTGKLTMNGASCTVCKRSCRFRPNYNKHQRRKISKRDHACNVENLIRLGVNYNLTSENKEECRKMLKEVVVEKYRSGMTIAEISALAGRSSMWAKHYLRIY